MLSGTSREVPERSQVVPGGYGSRLKRGVPRTAHSLAFGVRVPRFAWGPALGV